MSPSSGAVVQAYAGARYPERPLRVLWQGRWRNVSIVDHQEQRPDCRCFDVRLAPDDLSRDDTRLRLCYDYANDAWSVRPSSGGRRTVPPEATAK